MYQSHPGSHRSCRSKSCQARDRHRGDDGQRLEWHCLRLINVLPMTPVMLAEYVPPDFDVQQRTSAEEALRIVAKETGLVRPRAFPPSSGKAASITKFSRRRKR